MIRSWRARRGAAKGRAGLDDGARRCDAAVGAGVFGGRRRWRAAAGERGASSLLLSPAATADMEQAVALLHRTKEAPAGEKAGHFDQFLRLIRYASDPTPAPPRTCPLPSPSLPFSRLLTPERRRGPSAPSCRERGAGASGAQSGCRQPAGAWCLRRGSLFCGPRRRHLARC